MSEKYFDDAFNGSYRGVEILMSECNYEINSGNSTHNVFRGVVIRLEMNKNFKGLTIVRPKSVCGDPFDNNDLNLNIYRVNPSPNPLPRRGLYVFPYRKTLSPENLSFAGST